MIADAETGDVLYVESLVVFDDVTGNVSANVTAGDDAMECAGELATAFPFAESFTSTAVATLLARGGHVRARFAAPSASPVSPSH